MSEEKHPEADVSHRNGAGNKNHFQNPDVLKWIIVGLVCFVLVILAFGAGVKVGVSKAKFSYKWAESYHKNFGGPRGGFIDDWRKFPARDFINAHGSFGEIIEVKEKEFIVRGRENVEKVILTTEETIITKGREAVKEGLKVGDQVVIIGSPNEEGKIVAKLIRVFPNDKPTPAFPMRPGRSIPFF